VICRHRNTAPRREQKRPFSAKVLAVAILLAGVGAAAAEPPDDALEGRGGVLVPSQVLDGASLHLALAWQRRLGGSFWLHVEGGANRTTITGLTKVVQAPGGSLTLRGDQEQWTVPLLAGFAWQSADADGAGWDLLLAAGPAWTSAKLETSAVGGAKLGAVSEQRFDVMGLGRVDLTWPVRPGVLVVGVGWQEVLTPGDDRRTGDVRVSGLLLEGGWRAYF
jgi:hypothetical protein